MLLVLHTNVPTLVMCASFIKIYAESKLFFCGGNSQARGQVHLKKERLCEKKKYIFFEFFTLEYRFTVFYLHLLNDPHNFR